MPSLYVVATPIGNIEDISVRAKNILSSVDIIACEDTRHTQKLLKLLGIQRGNLFAYHEHNEKTASEKIIYQILEKNQSVALVTDAGTPCVSDPGYRLVGLAHRKGVRVSPLPGPCAVATAMSVAGLANSRWLFCGFLPQKSSLRKKEFLKWQSFDSGTSAVFYESPHRILKSLESLKEIHPNAHICVARELTKLHEEIISGELDDVLVKLHQKASIKGEFVVVVSPNLDDSTIEVTDEQLLMEVKDLLQRDPNLSTKILAETLSKKYSRNKKEVYSLLVKNS